MPKKVAQLAVGATPYLHLVLRKVLLVESRTRNGAKFEIGEHPVLAIDQDVISLILSRTVVCR